MTTSTRDEINERIAAAVGLSYADGAAQFFDEGLSGWVVVDFTADEHIHYTIAAADELIGSPKNRLLTWELFPTGAIVEWVVREDEEDDVFETDLVRVNAGDIPGHAHRLALALYRALGEEE
jgi:hypothetical protein